MNRFTHHIPTKIYFGAGQIARLSELADYGERVLLVYGGGSIKKSGLYDTVLSILKEAGLAVSELKGVEPNAKIDSVREGVKTCRENDIQMVLGVGGGSVIDCAKVVAAGALYENDPWELVIRPRKIRKALPVFAVPTVAATGSEMDQFAVISDMELHEKWGTGSRFLKPQMAICDPEYTYSVPRHQTAAGVADIMSHTLENYFTNVKGGFLQARFCEGVLKTCIKYGPAALERPDDQEARANLLWASEHAINGLLNGGAEVAWSVHPIEHELSAFYDITHGDGLAILTPHWMEFALNEETAHQFAEYGRNVWDIDRDLDEMSAAKEAIRRTREFFTDALHLPASLREVGIQDERYFDAMAEKAAPQTKGGFVPMTKEDVAGVLRNAL